MKKCFIFGMVFAGMFILSSLLPFALAQSAGAGSSSNPTLEEQLKLAKERVIMTYNPHPTGTPCNVWTCPQTMFFYPSIIVIGIVSGCIIFILLIKSRRTLNKAKRDFR